MQQQQHYANMFTNGPSVFPNITYPPHRQYPLIRAPWIAHSYRNCHTHWTCKLRSINNTNSIWPPLIDAQRSKTILHMAWWHWKTKHSKWQWPQPEVGLIYFKRICSQVHSRAESHSNYAWDVKLRESIF